MHKKITLLVLLMISACTNYTARNLETRKITEDGLDFYGNALKKTMDNSIIVYLKGTSYERGYQYGVLLRSEIQGFLKRSRILLDRILKSQGVLARLFAPAVINSKLQDMEKRIPADYLQFLKGMAEGCGEIDYNDLLFINFMPALANYGCTSIAAKNSEGKYSLLRNFDFALPGLLAGSHVFVIEEEPSGMRFSYLSFLCFIGVLHGINDAGLAISVNSQSFNRKTDLSTGLPSTVLTRQILQTAADLPGIKAVLSNALPIDAFSLTAVLGAENNALLIEANPAEFDLNISNQGAVVSNNFYLLPKMRKYDTSQYVYLDGRPSCARYLRSEKLLSGNRPLKTGDMLQILADNLDFYDGRNKFGVFQTEAEYFYNPWNNYQPDETAFWLFPEQTAINNHITVQSVLLSPSEKKVLYSTGRGFSAFNRYVELDMKLNARELLIKTGQSLSADSEKQHKAGIFLEFSQRSEETADEESFLMLIEETALKDKDNHVYPETKARVLLRSNAAEALKYLEGILKLFPDEILLKRLYGIALYEYFLQTEDKNLLLKSEAVFRELLNRPVHPFLGFDLYYRLLFLSSLEQDKEKFEQIYRDLFYYNTRLDSARYFPFNAMIKKIKKLQEN